MRRFHSMVWVLGSVFAACAAMAVTFAQAASGQQASGADRWSTEDRAVLSSLGLKRLAPAPVDPSNAVEQLPAAVDLGNSPTSTVIAPRSTSLQHLT
jgi:cytochrome c peroxidase